MHPFTLSACLCSFLANDNAGIVAFYSEDDVQVHTPHTSVRLGENFGNCSANFVVTVFVIAFRNVHEVKFVLGRLAMLGWLRHHQQFIFVAGGSHENISEAAAEVGLASFLLYTGELGVYRWSCGRGFEAVTNCSAKFSKQSCPIRVRMDLWPPFITEIKDGKPSSGFELTLMKTLASSLRRSVVYTVGSQWSEDFIDLPQNNFYALNARQIDILMSSLIPTVGRQKYFDFTTYYFEDSDDFCVPAAQRQPQFMKWFYLLPAYFILAASMGLISCIGDINTLSYFANICDLPSPPRTHHVVPRILFIFWMLLTMQINIIMESKLISVMRKPSYGTQLESLEDLLNSNLHFLLLSHYKRYFTKGSEVYNRIEDCPDIDQCLGNVSVDRTSTVCIQRTFLDFRMNNYRNSDGSRQIHCTKKPISTSCIVMIVNKNFHLLDELNLGIAACVESGLVSKWYGDVTQVNNYYLQKVTDFILALANLRLLFYLYLAGVSIACVVFVFELKMDRKRCV